MPSLQVHELSQARRGEDSGGGAAVGGGVGRRVEG
jgi:hypothetical protein